MPFPLGKPILVMICLSAIAGSVALTRPRLERNDLNMWIFAEVHARMYREPIKIDDRSTLPPLFKVFEDRQAVKAQISLISGQALDIRLMSLFMAEANAADTPDLAEIEIGSVGKYFRAPANEIGFLPLNDYLEKSGWMNRIVKARFAPWSKGAAIFGVPHDLHPSTLTYRKDLFDEAGVDLETATTWPELQQRCLAFEKYWDERGQPRVALALSTSNATDPLTLLLQQQHVNLVDQNYVVHMADDTTVKTLVWYTQAVTGPSCIGTDFNPAPGQNVRDLAKGEICGGITPDWMIAYLKLYGYSDLAGKLHMIPLPRFNPTDAPTASRGGTMIGITRACRNPDLAWKLIEMFYLDRTSLPYRQKLTSIIPPVPEYWSDPIYHQPDPLYAGQKINELYIGLAGELPTQYVTPYSIMAQNLLSVILTKSVAYARSNGPENLEPHCREWLQDGAKTLQRMIEFDTAK
jgi:arabinosaccharide transport system substrate-binding protein